MQQLANEYKKSVTIMERRISELKKLKKHLEDISPDPKKDPEVIEVNARLKPLVEMHKDLKALEKEVRNYYSRSWWRSPEFTCNKKVGAILRFAPFVNKKTCESIYPYFSVSYQTSKS